MIQKFDLSKIEMSRSDIRRGVKLPSYLSKELSEFIGIVIGDGHVFQRSSLGSKGHITIRSGVNISCNKNEELYINHIRKLFFDLFGVQIKYCADKRSQAAALIYGSLGIVQFLHEFCEIPINRKTEIARIPRIIKNSNDKIKCCFLRGLADTDFSVVFQNRTGKGHNYPVIKGRFKSKILVQDLEELFADLEFKHTVCYDLVNYDKRFGKTVINSIHLYGRKNFKRWVETIGFSNNKFIRKIEKWQRDGVCPPRY